MWPHGQKRMADGESTQSRPPAELQCVVAPDAIGIVLDDEYVDRAINDQFVDPFALGRAAQKYFRPFDRRREWTACKSIDADDSLHEDVLGFPGSHNLCHVCGALG